MKKIAFILPDLKGGGAQKMIVNLANEFAVRGYTVDLVLISSEGIYHDLVSPKVNLIEFKRSRSILGLGMLVQYMRDKKPDVIISALFHVNLIVVFAQILSGQKNTKLIISERNHLTKRLDDMAWYQETIIKFLVKRFYPKADHIVGISDGVCDDLKEIINRNDVVFKKIHNPVVTSDCENKLKESTDFLYSDDVGLKLVTSGRLERQKDYPTLLKAIYLYKKQYGDVHLVVLGEGSLKEKLVKIVDDLDLQDNVTFLGFVSNPLPIMAQADIYVQASAWEGFCNVIVEALYCGLKIVSTDCPSGPEEILENGKYGVLVSVGDENMMSQALYKMNWQSAHPSIQKERAMTFTVEKKADEFESLFK